jgi:hypothetical protein
MSSKLDAVTQFSAPLLLTGLLGGSVLTHMRAHRQVAPSLEPKRCPGDAAMVSHPRPLIEVLAEIPDVRCTRGRRHPLAVIFALAWSAMLCGYRSYSAMAEWGRNYGAALAQALGFTHQPPCAATLHTVLRRVDRDVVEAMLGAWAESVLTGVPLAEDEKEPSRSMAKRYEAAGSRALQARICSRSLPRASASPSPSRRSATRRMRSRWCWTSCAMWFLRAES